MTATGALWPISMHKPLRFATLRHGGFSAESRASALTPAAGAHAASFPLNPVAARILASKAGRPLLDTGCTQMLSSCAPRSAFETKGLAACARAQRCCFNRSLKCGVLILTKISDTGSTRPLISADGQLLAAGKTAGETFLDG